MWCFLIWLVSSNNFYYCRWKAADRAAALWLVSSNNFYYCRSLHTGDWVGRLVSSNNFYYCRCPFYPYFREVGSNNFYYCRSLRGSLIPDTVKWGQWVFQILAILQMKSVLKNCLPIPYLMIFHPLSTKKLAKSGYFSLFNSEIKWNIRENL